MAKLSLAHSSTSVILRGKIRDSTQSDGRGLTGLTSGSASLRIAVISDVEAATTAYTGSNLETITTLGTYAAPTSGKARFKEVDATNHPGIYEIQLADARYSVSNAKSMLVSVNGATNAVQLDFEIELTRTNNQDSVRGGMTAMPNAAAGANGGLATVDANNAVKVQSGTGANQISLASGLVTAGTVNDKTGYALTAAESNNMLTGTAQAGAAGTITLAANASSTTDFYRNKVIRITGGTGWSATNGGQARTIIGYNGSTKVATIDRNWHTNPASDSTYAILAGDIAFLDDGTATYDRATESLQAFRDSAATTQNVVDAVYDNTNGIESGLTLRQALRLITAATAGKVAGAGGTSVTIRNAVADSKTRITATVDADGNRTAVSTDVT